MKTGNYFNTLLSGLERFIFMAIDVSGVVFYLRTQLGTEKTGMLPKCELDPETTGDIAFCSLLPK